VCAPSVARVNTESSGHVDFPPARSTTRCDEVHQVEAFTAADILMVSGLRILRHTVATFARAA